jgi:hypothetical protein
MAHLPVVINTPLLSYIMNKVLGSSFMPMQNIPPPQSLHKPDFALEAKGGV